MKVLCVADLHLADNPLDGMRKRYGEQKRNARRRNVRFTISFADWVRVWLDSGKWHLRGRKKGCYVMSRIKDQGGYEVGNVEIIKHITNVSDCHLGRVKSKSERRLISNSKKGNKYALGHKHSETSRAKISAAKKGMIFTKKHRRNLSKARRAFLEQNR